MHTDQILYPLWYGRLAVPLSQIKSASRDSKFLLEYKYAVVERTKSNLEVLVRWEQLEDASINR